ncbi:prepilin-type N-terminal cleavage/methylation domain-containing protein [Comamonadaceae bacterium OH2310_COT-174]|nr:prepilin-type N-terminal cleavage/methylation domain-containing protein [Comamonadaceae bacterium OH2310_COT-174]
MKRMARGMAHGFTLLEMLVVMALLGLVMLGLGSSFYSLAQTETRIDARLDRASQLRSAMHFLEQTLGHVVMRRRPGVRHENESHYWFEGDAQRIRWIGIMPARYGMGGQHFFQLAAEPTEQGQALVLRFMPWQDLPQLPEPSQMQSRVLLNDLSHFAIRYRGEEQDAIAWAEQWRFPFQLPSHVMLEMHTTQLALPVKIIALRRPGAASQSGNRATVGGGNG